jgi:DNA polymerase-3 subunit beta
MKIEATAGTLADALAVAALATTTADVKRIAILGAVHLVAEGETVRLSVNSLDRYIETNCPAVVGHAGSVAVSAERLADLVAGFSPDAEVTLECDSNGLAVRCGRSRYKFPTLPIEKLPPTPRIDGDPLGQVELERGQALRVFQRPLFCAGTDNTRFYLNGIYLCTNGDGQLRAVATDGNRLCLVTVPATGSLSRDRRLIVPLASLKPIAKLLKKTTADPVVLRRSRNLLEVRTDKFSFISRLIDSEYPAFERVIPPAKRPNTAALDRAAMAQALARLRAAGEAGAAVALIWDPGATELRIPLIRNHSVTATETITSETAGSAQVAVSLAQLLELFEELTDAEKLLIECDKPGDPIRISIIDDDTAMAVQMPLRWTISEEEHRG